MSDRLSDDPKGDIIHPRIQYLEEWIRDCQRSNRNTDAELTAARDRIKDLEALVTAKNAELRRAADTRTPSFTDDEMEAIRKALLAWSPKNADAAKIMRTAPHWRLSESVIAWVLGDPPPAPCAACGTAYKQGWRDAMNQSHPPQAAPPITEVAK